MIPATPIADTQDTNPLVTYAQYTQLTGDSSNPSFVGDVSMAPYLAQVMDAFQRETRRTLTYAQYVERLYLFRNGMVYPTATPLDVTKPVVNPNGEAPNDNIGIFQGAGIWVGWFVPLPSLPVWVGVVPPQTDITYWGGWTGPAGPGPYLPYGITRILCKSIWFITHPVAIEGVSGNIKSTSVGGVSVSGELSSMVSGDRALCREITRWRHSHAKGFDGQVTAVTDL